MSVKLTCWPLGHWEHLFSDLLKYGLSSGQDIQDPRVTGSMIVLNGQG